MMQITGHGSKFERKKEQAIAALLSHRSVEEAARSIKLNPNTLLRWTKIPEFQDAYFEARRAAFGYAIARLHQASSAAVATLMRLTVDPSTPPAVRARSSFYILSLAKESIVTEGLEVAARQIERKSAESQSNAFDYSALTDDELGQLEAILTAAESRKHS